MKHNRICRVLTTLTLLLATSAQALPEDRSQPIRITADSATRDERSGETRYSGNVVLTQGTLQIAADEVIVAHTTEDANTIVATGSPATLTQKPAEDQSPVNAQAGRIQYQRDLDQVTLTENARIEQDGAIVTGAIINYLVTEQRVKATGDGSTKEGQRVEVIIPPSALDGGDTP